MSNVSDIGKRQRVRFGTGELVDNEKWFSEERRIAWTLYLLAAARIEPEIITSLLTDEGIDAARQTRELQESWEYKPERPDQPVPSSPDDPLDRFIHAWCEQWELLEYFAGTPGRNLLVDARRAREEGKPDPKTFTCNCAGVPFDPSDWGPILRISASFIMDPQTGRREQTSGIGSGPKLTVVLPELTWNPREEVLSSALARIMAKMEPIVRRELNRVRDEYIADGYKTPPVKRTDKHFEWLVRYQILGETRGDIARSLADERKARQPDWVYDPDVYKSDVGKQIRRAADLCGLKLKEQ